MGTMFLGNTYASEQKGTQIWTDASMEFKIYDSWDITLSEEMRYTDSDLSYYHTDIGFSSKTLIKGTKVGLNYRLYRNKNSKDKWSRVQSPHINFTLYDNLFKLPVSNRFRFQFLDKKNASDMWVFRNKTTIKLDDIFSIGNFKPYLSNEFFMNLYDDTQINRNRISSGLSYKINKNVKTRIFYLLQTTKGNNEWSNLDVLGFSLNFKF